MRAGELRQRITLQASATAQNSFGEEIETWVDVATVWAKVETLSGDEFIAQRQAGANLTHKITLRHRDDLQPTMRALWNDRIFEVNAILQDNQNRQMTLMCNEAVAVPAEPFIIGESLIGGRDVLT